MYSPYETDFRQSYERPRNYINNNMQYDPMQLPMQQDFMGRQPMPNVNYVNNAPAQPDYSIPYQPLAYQENTYLHQEPAPTKGIAFV
jgi:hypothetical protein